MTWERIWEDVYKNQEWGRYPCESLIRFMAGNFYQKDRKKIKVLEVGCGPGANVWYAARESFDVYGIDGSKTAIQRAKQRIKQEGLNADLRVGDVTSLPYESDYFDAVIDSECLYANSEDDTKVIITQINRVLKRGGVFFSKTVADKTYVGNSPRISNLEYKYVTEGPLAGKGFVRLINKEKIDELYGIIFKIKSIDRVEHTRDNESIIISEYSIVCQKR